MDPFLGSGSALVAAEKTGRVCRELDPLYVGVILRRFEAATGKPAVLAETGEAFEALAARRMAERFKLFAIGRRLRAASVRSYRCGQAKRNRTAALQLLRGSPILGLSGRWHHHVIPLLPLEENARRIHVCHPWR